MTSGTSGWTFTLDEAPQAVATAGSGTTFTVADEGYSSFGFWDEPGEDIY